MGWKGGGKGYGYQETCFKCQKVGHKAAECGVYEVVEGMWEETGECEAGKKDVGGVWVVAAVEAAVEEVSTMEPAWVPKRTEVRNSFKVFQVEEKEEEEDPPEPIEVVEELDEVVEITVGSWAARSVWPRRKKA